MHPNVPFDYANQYLPCRDMNTDFSDASQRNNFCDGRTLNRGILAIRSVCHFKSMSSGRCTSDSRERTRKWNYINQIEFLSIEIHSLDSCMFSCVQRRPSRSLSHCIRHRTHSHIKITNCLCAQEHDDENLRLTYFSVS